jgi:hypothetical protein
MVMIAAATACFITSSGRSAWFVDALLLFQLCDLRLRSTFCHHGPESAFNALSRA